MGGHGGVLFLSSLWWLRFSKRCAGWGSSLHWLLWPFLALLVVYWRSPCAGGTYFSLPPQRKVGKRKRLTPLILKREPRHFFGSGASGIRALAHYAPVTKHSSAPTPHCVRRGWVHHGKRKTEGDRTTRGRAERRRKNDCFVTKVECAETRIPDAPLPETARGARLMVSGLSPLSFAYFSLRRQRKVGAPPHRGNANRPLTNQGKAKKPVQRKSPVQRPTLMHPPHPKPDSHPHPHPERHSHTRRAGYKVSSN